MVDDNRAKHAFPFIKLRLKFFYDSVLGRLRTLLKKGPSLHKPESVMKLCKRAVTVQHCNSSFGQQSLKSETALKCRFLFLAGLLGLLLQSRLAYATKNIGVFVRVKIVKIKIVHRLRL